MGRNTSKTDQAGKTTQFFYDALGRLIKVKDALNQETVYGYNEIGQQISQTDALNRTTRYEYDRLGRRTKRILPLGQIETYVYGTDGSLTSKTDFNNKTTTFAYDNMRRLLSKTPDASLNQPTVSFTYNALGQRQTMTDATGTTNYGYDSRNRLTSKQTPFGTLSYSYDDTSNLSTVRSSNANGVSIDYSYDALNRLASVQDNRLPSGMNTTSYAYDSVGNLQSYTYPNGVTTSYAYNSLNRLTTLTVSNTASSLVSYSYTLGPSGNRTSVTELNGRSVSYTYDDLYRLNSETISNSPNATNNGTISYGYDAVGNRLQRNSTVGAVQSQSFSYDANDRLQSDSYDSNGNTISSNGNSYVYDFENRLTSTTGPSGAVTFFYDGDGNRVGKRVGGVTTNYLVDTNNHTGYAQVVEEIQSGSVTKQFTFGHDLISQRQLVNGNWTTSFYGYDGHGSVRLLTNNLGQVTDTYDYDAFGNLINRTGTTSNDYLYAGEQFDANLGFYYLRARYMNPSIGRFHSMDSYEGSPYDPISLHKYLYANANPENMVDPSGNFSLMELKATLVNIGILAANIVGRYFTIAYILANRFAYWFYANQVKIDFAWTTIDFAANVFLDVSTNLLLNNEDEVQLVNGNPGDWVEDKLGANANDYEIIDDFRDGNVTSIKTNQQNMDRLLRAIEKEAQTLGNRKQDFQPRNSAPPSVKSIPISTVKSRTLLMVIPENHASFLSNPTFVRGVRQIQQATRTAVNVIPLRRWRK